MVKSTIAPANNSNVASIRQEVPKAMKPTANITYLNKGGKQPQIFERGKPEQFEFITTEAQTRVFGQVFQMERFGVFIGSPQAQNELAKMKGIAGLQLMGATDLREVAEMFIELADILEGKL